MYFAANARNRRPEAIPEATKCVRFSSRLRDRCRARAMSKAAKDGNNFRREWDIEAFEKRAKERLDAELAASAKVTRPATLPGLAGMPPLRAL